MRSSHIGSGASGASAHPRTATARTREFFNGLLKNERGKMAKRRYSDEQIEYVLSQVESGVKVAEVCRRRK